MSVTERRFGPECLLPDLRNGTGESPVWDAGRGCWFWIDIPNAAIFRLDPDTGATRSWTLPEVVGSMVLRPDDGAAPRMICACTTGIFDVALPEQGEVAQARLLAPVAHPRPGMRFNDGRCDPAGRLLVSSMVGDIALREAAGRWYGFTLEGGLRELGHDGILVPNGSAFSPDGTVFYSSDTHPEGRMVWAHDYDVAAGRISNRRVFVDMREMVGRPDGATIDSEGGYWICCLDAGCIRRFTPQGVLDRVVHVPMQKPAMCAFGGPDRRQMLVTSLSRGGADLETDPHGGRVALIDPGAQGLPEPRFGATESRRGA